MLKKIAHLFLSFNLFTKIMIVFLIISIIPIFLIQVISYKISSNTIEKQTKELISSNLQQETKSVEAFFETYDNIIMGIYTDSNYVDNLKYINMWDTKRYEVAKHNIEEKLENLVYIHSELLGVAIIGINGDSIFYDAVTHSGERSFCFDVKQLKTHAMYKESLEVQNTIYSKTIFSSDDIYGNKRFIYIAHQLTDFNNYKNGPVGSIIFSVDESALRQVYSKGTDFNSNITFMMNQNGDIISFPIDKFVGKNIYIGQEITSFENAVQNFFQKNQLMNSKRLVVHISPIKDSTFMLVNIQDLNYALNDVRSISEVLIVIGVFAGWICILVAMTFASSTDNSVKKIIHAMSKADQGDYNVQISVDGFDEFATISNHFNQMILRINASNEQEREALLRRKNAEIKSLEAQINPHFLYNTLDAINWVAVEHEEFHISKMLVNLANILRYSIHKSNGIVTIREELEYLKRYIYLQHERFNYSFQYLIDVDQDLANSKIHKLILQPLIENSIVHGFPGNTGQDEIGIYIRKYKEGLIQIQVKDNGKGMSLEQVELFNHYDYKKDQIETSIGVRNVITRLALYYGIDGCFHVDSGELGTTVTLIIPYEY